MSHNVSQDLKTPLSLTVMFQESMRKLLILDLDETLIHTTKEWIGYSTQYSIDNIGYVFQRPGLAKFIADIQDHYELAIWTAAPQDYMEYIISNMLENADLIFAWSREECLIKDNPKGAGYIIKDLSKLEMQGYELKNVLVVDDKSESIVNSNGNLITVKPFYGNRKDTELAKLTKYLKRLATYVDLELYDNSKWREFER